MWEELSPHCWLWRWRRGPQAKECRQPPDSGKGKETNFPLEPPGKSTALPTPPLGRPWQTYDLQNHKIRSLHCLKPWSLQWCVVATTENQLGYGLDFEGLEGSQMILICSKAWQLLNRRKEKIRTCLVGFPMAQWLRICLLIQEATTVRSPCTAAREEPVVATIRQTAHITTKTQHSQK